MSQQSKIQWTEATWNPVRGCVKVSPGCAHCYAETFAERFRGVKGHPYEQGFDLRLVPDKLTEPLTWRKPRRVFVNSMSDLFQDGVSDEFIDQAFAVMALARQHTFQVLTKRPERMRAYFDAWHGPKENRRPNTIGFHMHRLRPEIFTDGVTKQAWPLPNVWLGVSVENQHFVDERIPLLLETPAAVRFISAEPLLEEVDLTPHLHGDTLAGHGYSGFQPGPRLDWVIVGGESGPGARPFRADWARSISSQCKVAGVPVFIKQLGSNVAKNWLSQYPLRDRKGGDMAEWPEDLRVREFPSASDGRR